MSLFKRSSVDTNPSSADSHLTAHGSDVYWAIFAIMSVATIAFSFLMVKTPKGERIFHYITLSIVLVASIAYYSMASNLGSTPVAVEFRNYQPSAITRQIFWVRYVDWAITTPLLLLDVLLLSGLPYSSILFVILADEVMIVTGLVGALTPTAYKFGYYVFGCVAFIYVAYYLVGPARTASRAISPEAYKLYGGISLFTLGLWTLYPIAWGVAEGGNVIASDSEAVFYGILDVLAKPVFGAWILLGHKKVGLDKLGLIEKRSPQTASGHKTTTTTAPASTSV